MYLYSVNSLAEEFRGSYKAYNIKLGLNHNKDLEGRQIIPNYKKKSKSLIIKTMILP